MKLLLAVSVIVTGACVPPGNATPDDAGSTQANAAGNNTPKQAPNVLTSVFEDNFDRQDTARGHRDAGAAAESTDDLAATNKDGGASDRAPNGEPLRMKRSVETLPDGSLVMKMVPEKEEFANGLGRNWVQAKTDIWHIEEGWLCGENARNHGVWFARPIPINARIEWDAKSDSPDGDLKAEIWGDGRGFAKGNSYNDATSYLAILGGWHNTLHVLARLDEHKDDRKVIQVQKDSDDPRQLPVIRGQIYHVKVERADGKTIRYYVDNLLYAQWEDKEPLVGIGHDHFGFNDWEAKVCFDNVKITPL